jgi:hypothetical protein
MELEEANSLGEENNVYKIKIFIFRKSTQKIFIYSLLASLKYLFMIISKSDIWSKDSCITHAKLLCKRVGFRV